MSAAPDDALQMASSEEPLQTSRRSSSAEPDTYVAPEQKSVAELMEQKEGEDEAMKRPAGSSHAVALVASHACV